MSLFHDWQFLEIVADVGVRLSSIFEIPRYRKGRVDGLIDIEAIQRRLRPPDLDQSQAYATWKETVREPLLDPDNGVHQWFTRCHRIYPIPWDELLARLYEQPLVERRIKQLAVRWGIARDLPTKTVDEHGIDESCLIDQPADGIVAEVRLKLFHAILRNAPNWVTRDRRDSWWGYCDRILKKQASRAVNAELGRPRTYQPDVDEVDERSRTVTNFDESARTRADEMPPEYQAQLREFLESLSDVERQVLELRYWQEKSRQAVAKELAVSVYFVAQCERNIKRRFDLDI